MYSTSDFEKLWFLYQTEGSPKGISINTYCAQHGIAYTQFYGWLRNRQQTIVKVEVEGLPVESSPCEESPVCPASSVSNVRSESSSCGGILVSIQTRSGLHVRKGNLTYQELKNLVENLEVLC